MLSFFFHLLLSSFWEIDRPYHFENLEGLWLVSDLMLSGFGNLKVWGIPCRIFRSMITQVNPILKETLELFKMMLPNNLF
jgi:hypothetical protein